MTQETSLTSGSKTDRATAKEFVDLFCYLYKERYGKNYKVPASKWAKHCGQFKTLQRSYTDDDITDLLEEFFTTLGTATPVRLSDPISLFIASVATLFIKVSGRKKRDAKGRADSDYERLEARRQSVGKNGQGSGPLSD